MSDMELLAELVDVEKVLAPISHSHPLGKPFRYEPLFDQIQEARREDDPIDTFHEHEDELKKSDWQLTNTLCQKALCEKTKDVLIFFYLTESWIYLHGIKGAVAGFRLLRLFFEKFLPEIIKLEPQDLELQVGSVEWADIKIPPALQYLTLAPKTNPYPVDYLLIDFFYSHEQKEGAYQKRKDVEKDEFNKFLFNLTQADANYREILLNDLMQTKQEIDAINELLSEKLPAGRISKILITIKDYLALIPMIFRKYVKVKVKPVTEIVPEQKTISNENNENQPIDATKEINQPSENAEQEITQQEHSPELSEEPLEQQNLQKTQDFPAPQLLAQTIEQFITLVKHTDQKLESLAQALADCQQRIDALESKPKDQLKNGK